MNTDNQTSSAPARITPLATLPVFFKLAGAEVLLIGGNEGAAWKAELMAACGARLSVISPEFDEAMFEVARGDYGAGITLHTRMWSLDDMARKRLVIADVETEGEAYAVKCAARAVGVPVNVVDKPAFCDFSFATIVNRSPLIVAISTDGAAPILGQTLRQRIEAILPMGLAKWAEEGKAFRDRLQEIMPEKKARRSFWQRFSQLALSSQSQTPTQASLERLAEETRLGRTHGAGGRVSFVGAGPGDPDLLTLKAVRRLQEADVILHDALVGKEILELARREAARIPVGKRARGESMAQGEIDALIMEKAREGNHVVRLKGGDPAIFGRLESELAACREAGLPFDIVPGITTASALASAAATPLTAREKAASLTLYSGHDFARENGEPQDEALIFYMPKAAAGEIAQKLEARGFAPSTPCIIGVAISTPSEQAVQTTLARLASEIRALNTQKPVIVAVGQIFGRNT